MARLDSESVKEMTDQPEQTSLERGRALLAEIAPDIEPTIAARYDELLPGMSQNLVEWSYGNQYSRPGLDLKSRYIATIAALTALGGQTRPQLKVNIRSGLKAGLSKTEIAETIWQMSLYGGLPASINALNAAIEIFEEQNL